MNWRNLRCTSVILACSCWNVYGDVNQWPSVEEDHTNLQIVVPEALRIKGGYQHRDALFGFPDYVKGSLQTQLIHANATACSDLNTEHWEPPFALLVDRGECHFVEKVRYAQHAGARAVIIADNTCLCNDVECMQSTGDRECEAVLPFMADDESGGDISIPSMLIRKSDAQKIKDYIKHEDGLSNVMVKFEWGIPSPDGRVEWSLWHSAWDEQSMAALNDLQSIVEKLGNRAFFTPHFVSYNGSKVGCQTGTAGSENPCGNMCVNVGRYCLLDPSPFHDQASGASGSDVVVENLRRECIWQIVSKDDPGVGLKWWKYVSEFAMACQKDEAHFKDPKCSASILQKIGISAKDVNECMMPYGEDVDQDNPLLAYQLRNQTNLQLLRLPALYVDGVHARGRINAATTLSMICAGYGVHNPPEICECANETPMRLMECVQKGSYAAMNNSASGGFSSGSVLFIVIFLAIGGVVVGLVYYRRTQRQMREQVRSILAEYMPLDEQSFPGELDSPKMHPAAVASAKSPRGFLPTRSALNDDEDGV